MNEQTTAIASATLTSGDTPTLEATIRQKRLALERHQRLPHAQPSAVQHYLGYVSGDDDGTGFRPASARRVIGNFQLRRPGIAGCLRPVHGLLQAFGDSWHRQCDRRPLGDLAVLRRQLPAIARRAHRHRRRIEPAAPTRREHLVAVLSQGTRLGADVSSFRRQLRLFHRPRFSVDRFALYGLAHRLRRFWRGKPDHGTRALHGPRARVGRR